MSKQAKRFKQMLVDNGYTLCNKDGKDLTPAELAWLMGGLYLIVREDRVEPEDREELYNNQFILNVSIDCNNQEAYEKPIQEATADYHCDGEYLIGGEVCVYTFTFQNPRDLREANIRLSSMWASLPMDVSIECPMEDEAFAGFGCGSGCRACSPGNQDEKAPTHLD